MPIDTAMLYFLQSLKRRVPVAVVGGSDLDKIFEQFGGSQQRDQCLAMFDFVFAENGLTGFKGRTPLPSESISKELGEAKCQELTNFCLKYMSETELPLKRGNFVEHRNGMINVSPVGRSCSQAERDQFVLYERTTPVRSNFVDALQKRFPTDQYRLSFSIGGQISIDIFPVGWDKTFCLRYLKPCFDKIHFFGDKTLKGGNDYEIFEHPDTVGHTVASPEHCRTVVEKTLAELGL
uniref:Phosphomannomutase n=1 Tax=Globodera rostochiensis TaxID=31243 RepID=A0A914GUK9_GLORO